MGTEPRCLAGPAATGAVRLSPRPRFHRPQPGGSRFRTTAARGCLTRALHLPMLMILASWAASSSASASTQGPRRGGGGTLPPTCPTVCVQFPMFNEHAVARRDRGSERDYVAGDRLSVQVLDDSTDPRHRALVDRACSEVRASTGVACHAPRREDRQGYKAGALEVGRREIDAEFLVIFDADFLPPADYLQRTLPHFYRPDGGPTAGSRSCRRSGGTSNADESALTRAQSLWSTTTTRCRCRGARRCDSSSTSPAPRACGERPPDRDRGRWRAASLVEDCELSFRHLFAGYRTKFVKEIVAPAELPATFTAYKAQQKRWTQGWVQLQCLHLRTLSFEYRCSPLRRLAFAYHMCISWQSPLGTVADDAAAAHLQRPVVRRPRHRPASRCTSSPWRCGCSWPRPSRRSRPGTLPPLSVATFRRRCARPSPTRHQHRHAPAPFSASTEGLFVALHSDSSARRSPLRQVQPVPRRAPLRRQGPLALRPRRGVLRRLPTRLDGPLPHRGPLFAAIGTTYVGACIASLAYFYGDHEDRVCFVFNRARTARAPASTVRRIGPSAFPISRPLPPTKIGEHDRSPDQWRQPGASHR